MPATATVAAAGRSRMGGMRRTARPGRLAPALPCRRRCGALGGALVPIVFTLTLTGCGGSAVYGPDQQKSSSRTVASPALPGGTSPREFTCDGANWTPRLRWSSLPPGTKELVIELFEPDAPG